MLRCLADYGFMEFWRREWCSKNLRNYPPSVDKGSSKSLVLNMLYSDGFRVTAFIAELVVSKLSKLLLVKFRENIEGTQRLLTIKRGQVGACGHS